MVVSIKWEEASKKIEEGREGGGAGYRVDDGQVRNLGWIVDGGEAKREVWKQVRVHSPNPNKPVSRFDSNPWFQTRSHPECISGMHRDIHACTRTHIRTHMRTYRCINAGLGNGCFLVKPPTLLWKASLLPTIGRFCYGSLDCHTPCEHVQLVCVPVYRLCYFGNVKVRFY